MYRVRLIMLLGLAFAATAHAEHCASGPAALEALREGARTDEASLIASGMASGADLGFTLGSRDSNGRRIWLLGLWKRGDDCAWNSIFEGQIDGDGAASQSVLRSGVEDRPGLPEQGFSAGAGTRAIDDFERAALADGVASALHVYALDRGFQLRIAPNVSAAGTGAASLYLTAHPWLGSWRDTAREHSDDGELLYALGDILDKRGRITRHYLQIWQYDPLVANWGLRLLWSSARLEGD